MGIMNNNVKVISQANLILITDTIISKGDIKV